MLLCPEHQDSLDPGNPPIQVVQPVPDAINARLDPVHARLDTVHPSVEVGKAERGDAQHQCGLCDPERYERDPVFPLNSLWKSRVSVESGEAPG